MANKYNEWKFNQVEGLVSFAIVCLMVLFRKELIDILGMAINHFVG